MVLIPSCYLLPIDLDVTVPEQNLAASAWLSKKCIPKLKCKSYKADKCQNRIYLLLTEQIQTNGHIEHFMDGETLVEGDIIKKNPVSSPSEWLN